MKAILLALILALVFAEKVRYNGYSVLRMQINSTNHEDIENIAEKFNLDVWQRNAVEKWIDIMIPPNPEILNIIKQHNHVVSIEDVEEHLLLHEGPRNVTQKRASNQVFFDYFPQYPEIEEWLYAQVDSHPQNAQIITAGRTAEGRSILGLRIFQSGGTKRQIFLHGGIHAREWITVTTALYIIQELFDSNLLNSFDFYVVPVLNVDGYIYAHNTQRLWRKNRQTNSGSTCVGTDLNRNYRYEWGRGGSSTNPCADTYMGTAPNSTPELASITSYIAGLTRLAFFLDIHSYGSMFMSPWGYTYTNPPDYNAMYDIMVVARSGISAINGRAYAIGTSANVIYIASGGSDDWVYGDLGVIPSFVVEIAGNSFTAPTSSILPLAQEIWNGVASVADVI